MASWRRRHTRLITESLSNNSIEQPRGDNLSPDRNNQSLVRNPPQTQEDSKQKEGRRDTIGSDVNVERNNKRLQHEQHTRRTTIECVHCRIMLCEAALLRQRVRRGLVCTCTGDIDTCTHTHTQKSCTRQEDCTANDPNVHNNKRKRLSSSVDLNTRYRYRARSCELSDEASGSDISAKSDDMNMAPNMNAIDTQISCPYGHTSAQAILALSRSYTTDNSSVHTSGQIIEGEEGDFKHLTTHLRTRYTRAQATYKQIKARNRLLKNQLAMQKGNKGDMSEQHLHGTPGAKISDGDTSEKSVDSCDEKNGYTQHTSNKEKKMDYMRRRLSIASLPKQDDENLMRNYTARTNGSGDDVSESSDTGRKMRHTRLYNGCRNGRISQHIKRGSSTGLVTEEGVITNRRYEAKERACGTQTNSTEDIQEALHGTKETHTKGRKASMLCNSSKHTLAGSADMEISKNTSDIEGGNEGSKPVVIEETEEEVLQRHTREIDALQIEFHLAMRRLYTLVTQHMTQARCGCAPKSSTGTLDTSSRVHERSADSGVSLQQECAGNDRLKRENSVECAHPRVETPETASALLLLIEDLMNTLHERPTKPYISIKDSYLPVHINLLLSLDLAERHPDNNTLLRLLPLC